MVSTRVEISGASIGLQDPVIPDQIREIGIVYTELTPDMVLDESISLLIGLL
jgi:hypothetical protein